MALTWVSVDMMTGQVIADLPGIECDWPLRRTIGRSETATARLYLDGAPVDWEYAVREGGAVLACYDSRDEASTIQWAGFVLSQTRDTATDSVALTLATAEAYLDRRYVGDKTYAQVGQNAIIADLVNSYVIDGANGEAGIPLALQYTGAGALRDRTYADADNASVYTRMTQLSATLGGPEFTIEWAWVGGNHVMPTLVIADRIGIAKPADRDPDALFDMPGSVVNAQQVRDYSNGKGATKVAAFGSAQSDNTIPTSGPVYATNTQGRPTFEYRWSPGSSITDPSTLLGYARGALAILAPGARAMTLTASLAEAPTYGVDWRLGDDVGYAIGGYDEQGRDTVAAFPGGITGYGRVIAYELTDRTISPILAEAAVYEEGDDA